MMKIKTLGPALAAALLVACGGGGGGSAVTNTLSGKVIDGYIKGAKICLDINSNGSCDSNEPSAITGAGGAYTLSYAGDLAGMHVIAEVPSTAYDEDDNGKTLAEAGKEAFSLFAPAESAAAVTPLTTLVSVEMITSPGSSMADAQSAVKANNNIQVDLLGNDYVSKQDTNTHTLAKKIVDAVVAAQKELDLSSEFKNAETAKPKLASMKAAVSQVQASVLPQMISANGSVNSNFDAKAAATAVIQGNLNNIIAQTKSGDGTVVSMVDILKEGLIVGEGNKQRNILDKQNQVRNSKGGLEISYVKIGEDLSSFKTDKEYIYTTPYSDDKYQTAVDITDWYKAYDSGSEYFLVNGKWEVYNEKIKSIEGNCVLISQTLNDGGLQKFCATSKNLSGKKVIDLIKDACLDDDDKPVNGCNVNQTFPEGSFGYDLQVTTQSDSYRVWVSTGGNGFDGRSTSIDEILVNLKNYPSCVRWCNVEMQIKSYDSVAKTGRMQWRKRNTLPFIEETGFVVINLNGVNILKYENSNLLRVEDDEDRVWGILAEVKLANGSVKVEQGDFDSKNMRQSIPFNGSTKIGNAKVLDAFIKMRNMKPFPY